MIKVPFKENYFFNSNITMMASCLPVIGPNVSEKEEQTNRGKYRSDIILKRHEKTRKYGVDDKRTKYFILYRV